jgi:hypothetical protein
MSIEWFKILLNLGLISKELQQGLSFWLHIAFHIEN